MIFVLCAKIFTKQNLHRIINGVCSLGSMKLGIYAMHVALIVSLNSALVCNLGLPYTVTTIVYTAARTLISVTI